MTKAEIERAIQEFRNQGYGDEELIETFKMMYLDNKIDRRELNSLLDVLGYELSDDYKDLSKADIRKLELDKITSIHYDPETKETKDYSYDVFNQDKYINLLESARKTKSGTEKFIDYISGLDCNLRLESMKYIKLSLMKGTKYTSKFIKDLLASSRYKDYPDFYHLYLAYWECNKSKHPQACKIIEDDLMNVFYINYKHPENQLVMSMERLFTSIEMYEEKNIQKSELKKLVNTLKVKFLIMHRNYYPKDNVNIFLGSPKALLKQCEDKMDKTILNEILKYYERKYYEIEGLQPNGYKVLFFALLDKGGN